MNPKQIYIVEYLNALPFLHGLESNKELLDINIHLEVPSACATAFEQGNADIVLMPIGALINHHAEIISNYCIGCDGTVKTVCVFSNKKSLADIRTIKKDPSSKTSNKLLDILIHFFWKREDIIILDDDVDNNADASLIIGDAAFLARKNHSLIIDLGYEWKKFTTLPFVFAVWISKIALNKKFIEDLNNSLRFGLKQIASISNNYQDIDYKETLDYLTHCISYEFDDRKKEALALYHDYAKQIDLHQSRSTC